MHPLPWPLVWISTTDFAIQICNLAQQMDAILLEQLVTELMEDKIRCRRLRSPVPLDVSDLRSPGLHCVFLFLKGYLGMPDMNDGETETDPACPSSVQGKM